MGWRSVQIVNYSGEENEENEESDTVLFYRFGLRSAGSSSQTGS
jgi:hypothetical protein